jgi:hypothetical protein
MATRNAVLLGRASIMVQLNNENEREIEEGITG